MLVITAFGYRRDTRSLNRNEDRTSEARIRAGRHRGPLALWRRLALWPRLVIAVTLGLVVLFVGLSLLAIRAVDDSTNRILQERLAFSGMLAQEFDRLLTHTFSELAAFHPGASSLSEQRRLLEGTYERGRGPFAAIYLLDRTGRVVLALGPAGRVAGADLSRKLYVAKVLATRQRGISAPFWDSRGRPVVALSNPILDRDGTVRAILVSTLDMSSPDVMERLDTAERLGRTGHAQLVGQGGIAIASTEPGDVLRPGEHLEFYRSMLRAREPGIENVPHTPWRPEAASPRNEHHVMAFARLSTAPWGVARAAKRLSRDRAPLGRGSRAEGRGAHRRAERPQPPARRRQRGDGGGQRGPRPRGGAEPLPRRRSRADGDGRWGRAAPRREPRPARRARLARSLQRLPLPQVGRPYRP